MGNPTLGAPERPVAGMRRLLDHPVEAAPNSPRLTPRTIRNTINSTERQFYSSA
jgi:hypothetical protein